MGCVAQVIVYRRVRDANKAMLLYGRHIVSVATLMMVKGSTMH